ncbi:MAG TPA: hypothetical protein VHG72_13840 [Polyangia bacterium]|nr:hypothetical protein [Polyangia bacterium]
MPGGQALDLQRASGWSADPNELVIIDTPGDPLYQKERNDLPITRDAVLAIAIGPPASSIRVRRLPDGRHAVATGRQRTKAAAVANSIGCGIKYAPPDGGLKSVHQAIAEFKEDADFVTRITTLMKGTPRRLSALPANDSVANVRGMIATENALAQAESREAQIRALQEDVNTFEVPIEIAAARRGLKVSTAKRLLKVDLSAPRGEPKTRGKATRPSAKIAKAIAAHIAANQDGLPVGLATLAKFFAGEATAAELAESIPGLAAVLGAKGEKAKAA